MDPGYTVRLVDEGAVSVVAAAHDVAGEDEADSVAAGKGRPAGFVQPEESAGEVGGDTMGAACIQLGGSCNVKRKNAAADGPSESEQSTLKVNPEAPGWIKRYGRLNLVFGICLEPELWGWFVGTSIFGSYTFVRLGKRENSLFCGCIKSLQHKQIMLWNLSSQGR
jgi:hypothetical protein